MNKILERHEHNDQYDTWFVVKQSYDFETIKFFIKKIAEFTRITYDGSFQKFVEDDENAINNKTLSNFRNAKTLIDLNLVTNDFLKKYPKYKNYDIDTTILKNINDDEKLKVAINKRMLEKEFYVTAKSNKPSEVSKKRKVVELPIFRIYLKVLQALYEKIGSTFITDFEIDNFVVLMKDETEINDVVEAITLFRSGKTVLKNKMSEVRFHKAVENMIPIKKIGKKSNFDYLKVKEMLDGVVKDTSKEINDDASDYFKRTVISSRNSVLQSKWKRSVAEKFDLKCALCSISHSALLIGSHIKSVSECRDDEDYNSMYDVDNGILLCANHDKLFDKRLISINKDGSVIGNTQGVASGKIKGKYINDKTIAFLEYHKQKFNELIIK